VDRPPVSTPPIPPAELLAELRAAVRGPVIDPSDPGYGEASAVSYSGFDLRPAAVVRAADAADVARVVSLGRDTGVELAVRSGGHSVAGHGTSDGGIVLDLSGMNALDVDVAGRTAWAGAGATAGDYTRAVGAHGLATGFGDAPTVGIGGLTLGGGVGYLHRRYGLTIDCLLAADVVTADGAVLRVDAGSHPDLFWAIRGGGGNFGVATRLRFRLHEVDGVVGGTLMLHATPSLIASFIAEAAAAPDELSGVINIMHAPGSAPFPPDLHGRLILVAALVYAGPAAAGARALAPLRALAPAIADQVRPMRYRDVYEAADGAPHPMSMAVRSLFVDECDVASAEAMVEGLRSSTAPMSVVQFRVLGGAVARVPGEATAFAHRHRGHMVTVAAAYDDASDAPRQREWSATVAGSLRTGFGSYVGFLGDEGEDRVRDAYAGPTWDRLRDVKRRYDAANVFRRNQNIPPAAG
jgi:FAD/FMN-containing dehydrogenase